MGVLSPTSQNVWQEWDAAHIAPGRLANPKRDVPSYLAKTNTTSTCFSSPSILSSSTLRNAWHKWDAAHTAPGRLANPTRDAPSYLSKNNSTSNVDVFLVTLDSLVVDHAKCVAGVRRGAHCAGTPGPPKVYACVVFPPSRKKNETTLSQNETNLHARQE